MLNQKQAIELTPEEYTEKLIEAVSNGELPKGELDSIHVRYEQKTFDPSTGRRLSYPKVQTYDVKEWGDTPERGVQGYLRSFPEMEIVILYDPRAKKAKKKSETPVETSISEDSEESVSRRGRKRAAEKETLLEVVE